MNYKNPKYHLHQITPEGGDRDDIEFFERGEGMLDHLPDEEVKLIREKMLGRIKAGIECRSSKPKKEYILHHSFAAAVILFLFINFLSATYFKTETIRIETLSNEIKEILLPDGSIVTLNEESSVEYPISWNGYFNRKIDLIGEAYFNVARHPSGQEFIINEGKPFSIVVKGTSFNYSGKNYKHKVSLESGLVDIIVSGKAENHNLKPGELAIYSEARKEIEIIESSLISGYSAWRKEKLTLDNHTLPHVLDMIAEIYQIKPFEETLPNARPISGTIPLAEDIEEVIANISTAFNIPLLIDNDNIRVAVPDKLH